MCHMFGQSASSAILHCVVHRMSVVCYECLRLDLGRECSCVRGYHRMLKNDKCGACGHKDVSHATVRFCTGTKSVCVLNCVTYGIGL